MQFSTWLIVFFFFLSFTYRCQILSLILLALCVDSLGFHFGSFFLLHWLERQLLKLTYRLVMPLSHSLHVLDWLGVSINFWFSCSMDPLFDICYLISFCKFFAPVMSETGHEFSSSSPKISSPFPSLQTVFIISVCNNQLLDWMENELIWVLSLVPGFAPVLPNLVAKLHTMRAKYLKPQQPSSHIKVRP